MCATHLTCSLRYGFTNFFPGLVSNHDPFIPTFQVAEITIMSHCTYPSVCLLIDVFIKLFLSNVIIGILGPLWKELHFSFLFFLLHFIFLLFLSINNNFYNVFLLYIHCCYIFLLYLFNGYSRNYIIYKYLSTTYCCYNFTSSSKVYIPHFFYITLPSLYTI